MRLNWLTGQYETSGIQCGACGDRNAWGQKHQCCEEQCRKSLNALRSFPFAAWGDISGAPLDPQKVVEARKLEIEYATKKPVWHKAPRQRAKAMGWKVI